MERKLIKQGGGGYTIYLPKKWIDRKGLKGKDIVDLIELDNALMIKSSIKGKKTSFVKIEEETKKNLKEIVTFLYRTGFDEFTLENVDEKSISEIQKITKNLLLGFEITKKDSSSVTLENISEPTDQKYDVIIRRIFLIIREMFEICDKSGKDVSWKKTEEIEEMRNQVDKFVLFCRRTIMKEMYEKNPVFGWELLNFFALTGHSINYLYDFASENKIKTGDTFLMLVEALIKQFDLLYNAYYSKNIGLLYKVSAYRGTHLFGKCTQYIEKAKGKEAVIASYIRELVRLMQIGINPILAELISNIPRRDIEN